MPRGSRYPVKQRHFPSQSQAQSRRRPAAKIPPEQRKESDLKKFVKWYWAHLDPSPPEEFGRFGKNEMDEIARDIKKQFHQDDDWILPSMSTRKKKPAQKSGKTRTIKVTVRRR